MIRPILRGRDICRYSYHWANLWLICTHNGVKDKGITKIPRIDINDYPAVKKHLDKYWDRIQRRDDQGDTPYNLRNCAYWGNFLTSKIVYQELTQGSCFYYDEKAEYFILQTAYFISGNTNLDYLTKLLNSKFIEYCFRKFYSTSMGKSGFRWLSQYVEKLPIALYDNTAIQQKIVLCSHQTDDENIDNLIYQMYGLTQEEISTIEQS